MAVNDFSNQNIQDTYQRVVQTDGTNVADGTGSLLPISFEGNDVIIPGALKAQSYIVSESIVNVSSGSTVFGNSSDDTHTFTGNITSSGTISASGVGTFFQISSDQKYIANGDTIINNTGGTLFFGAASTPLEIDADGITLDSSVTATGTIGGSNLSGTNTGDQSLVHLAVTSSDVTFANITSSGNISASGTILGRTGSFERLVAQGDILLDEGKAIFFDGTDSTPNTKISKNGTSMDFRVNNQQRLILGTSETVFSNNLVRIGSTAAPKSLHVTDTISGSKDLTVATHITASGNISASGTDHILGGDTLIHGGDLTIGQSGVISSGGGHAKLRLNNQGVGYEDIILFDKANTNKWIMGVQASTDYFMIAKEATTLTGTDPVFSLGTSGDITASGDISASGDIIANAFNVSNIVTNHITASGNISSSGNLISSKISIDSAIEHKGDNTTQIEFTTNGVIDLNTNGTVRARITDDGVNINSGRLNVNSHITSSGNITASGTITADKIRAGGYAGSSVFDIAAGAGGIDTDGPMSCTVFSNSSTSTFGGRIIVTGGVGSYIETTSYVSASEFRTTGNITASGNISSSGDVIANNISASGDIVINEGQKLILDGNDTAGLTPAGNTFIQNAGTSDEIEMYVGGTQKLEIKQDVVHFNNGRFKVTGNITASDNISSSGNIIASSIGIGTPTPNHPLHIVGSSPQIRLEADGNTTPQIRLLNNQSPDFMISNQFSDGGFQISSTSGPVKSFVTIGASDGDVIELSGSVNVTGTNGHITASGNVKIAAGTSLPTTINSNGIDFNPESNGNGVSFKVDEGNSKTTIAGLVEFELNANKIELGTAANNHVTASGDISSSGDIEALTFTSPTLDVTGGSAQITAGKNLTFGSLVTTDVGRLNIDHDDSEGTISNVVGDLTITNSGTGDTVIANQGSTGKIILAPNEAPGPNVNSGQVLISGTSGNEGAPPHLMVEGNITSSGIISSSATIIANGVNVDSAVTFNSNRRIIYSTADDNLVVQDSSLKVNSHITASGNISSSATLIVQKNQFLKTNNTTADHQGDVVFFGGTTSMTAGTIYYFNSSGNWAQTDADAESSAKGLLAVALGTASDTDGMLLRGTVTLSHDPGTIGDVLYLSVTAGQASSTVPSGNGDIVRIIGYCLDSSNNQIWFNPDNTFVEVSA